MSDARAGRRPLPGCFRGFPGAVLQLSADGTVLDSNGRLEAALDRALIGRPFAEALDADSSGAKWERLRAAATKGDDAPGAGAPVDGTTAELVLAGRDTLPEPRAFSVLRDPDGGVLWLVEHPGDGRLDLLREQVTEVNSELANTQRELLKERSRLARLLAELEEQYRTQERLSAMLRERNAEIEQRNAELVATTRELERSNRALDEFAHVVSHDLKAPLRGIANYARWIEEDHGAGLGDAVRSQLAELRGQAARMRAMIDGVLAYARAGRAADAGGAAVPVDLAELVDEVVALLAPPAAVTVTVERPMPTIVTTPVPLAQVIQNLVDNAIEHARRADPRVRVSARVAGEWCEIAVTDNGPGVPPHMGERIWALFHTGEPGDGTEHTGIGLAVVRREVEAHGGNVWVEPGEGAGATFRFRWPAHPRARE